MGAFPGLPGTVQIGHARVHRIDLPSVLDVLHAAVSARRRLVVHTCNVDHLVKLERDPAFRAAYDAADLVTADGAPVVALSRAMRCPLPGRVTGADLAPELARVCAEVGVPLALVGGRPGVADRAADELRRRHPTLEVVVACPRMGFRPGDAEEAEIVAHLRASAPAAYLVCLGAPTQELWIHRLAGELPPGVLIGAGAAVDFLAGTQRRAPLLARRLGVEFAWRLLTDGRRLWRRYLVEDLAFVTIAARALRVRCAAQAPRHHPR